MSEDKSSLSPAIKSAMNILTFADNTKKRLYRKLREKGYSEEDCREAVEYAVENGFLDEDRMLEASVRNLSQKKLFGRKRIIQELKIKGFSDEAINGFDFEQIDFLPLCRELFIKRGGIPDEKTKAFLLRYGHSFSDIREVFENEEE